MSEAETTKGIYVVLTIIFIYLVIALIVGACVAALSMHATSRSRIDGEDVFIAVWWGLVGGAIWPLTLIAASVGTLGYMIYKKLNETSDPKTSTKIRWR